MITAAERTRLKNLFSDTISLLCRGGFPGSCASRVDALIGITLDNQEVVLVNFSENFAYENENQTRQEINGEINSDAQCSHMPQKSYTSGECSYSVNDECEAGTRQDLCNRSALVTDRNDGPDIIIPNFHVNSHHTELQDVKSSDQVSRIDSLVTESEQAPVLESNSDCLLIKMELPEDNVVANNISAKNDDFVSSADRIAIPSVHTAHRSTYSSSNIRMKHTQNIHRRAQCNPYASKFYRPHQRCNSMERKALYSSQVSQLGNDALSMQQLDAEATGLLACAPQAGDCERGGAAVRELIQCHMCGAWLRGRQTLNEHIRGKHLSIYNYHCKYCGLSFKWRSAQRNHQLNCSASGNQQ